MSMLPEIFALRDAYAGGLTYDRLRYMNLEKVASGVVQVKGKNPSLQQQLIACSRAVPQSVIASLSAAQFYGLRLPPLENQNFYLYKLNGRQIKRKGMIQLRSRLAPEDIISTQDYRITSLERTFLDLGQILTPEQLVYIADGLFAYHRAVKPGAHVIRQEHLEAYIAEARYHQGKKTCLQALELAVVGSDSHKETELRLLLRKFGITHLVANPVIRDETGAYITEPDLADFDNKLSIQYEGAHHGTIRQMQRDEQRRARTEAIGWREVKIFAPELYQEVFYRGEYMPVAVAKVLAAQGYTQLAQPL